MRSMVYYPEVPMKSAPENKAKTEESDQTKDSALDQTTTTVQQPSTKERADLINGETSVNQSRRLRALSVPAFADSPASANINNQVQQPGTTSGVTSRRQMSPITKKLGHRQYPTATPNNSAPSLLLLPLNRQCRRPNRIKAVLCVTCVALQPHLYDAVPVPNKFSACHVTICITVIRGGQRMSGRPCPTRLPPSFLRHSKLSDLPYHLKEQRLSLLLLHPERTCAKGQRLIHLS